jgi:hypothetical protein
MFLLLLLPFFVAFLYLFSFKNKNKNKNKKRIDSVLPIDSDDSFSSSESCEVASLKINALSPNIISNNFLKSILGDSILKNVEYKKCGIIYYFYNKISSKEIKVYLNCGYDLIPKFEQVKYRTDLIFSQFTTENIYYTENTSTQVYVGLEFVSEDSTFECTILSYHISNSMKKMDVKIFISYE